MHITGRVCASMRVSTRCAGEGEARGSGWGLDEMGWSWRYWRHHGGPEDLYAPIGADREGQIQGTPWDDCPLHDCCIDDVVVEKDLQGVLRIQAIKRLRR